MLIAGRHPPAQKRDLAIYSNRKRRPHAPFFESRKPRQHSADYASLQAMVSEFLAQVKMSVDVASFDVAGPVINGRVKTTNLPWVMDETFARERSQPQSRSSDERPGGVALAVRCCAPPT